MDVRRKKNEPDLTALLIAPDRELAAEFAASLRNSRAFQVIAELKSYPPLQTLEIRLRQMRPDAVIVDTGTSPDAAAEVIRFVANLPHSAHVVGLNRTNDPGLILTALRLGATEFLHVPFDTATQHEAAARLRRLRQSEPAETAEPGAVAAFSSAKPGAGASIIATQTAFALRRATGKRILLADFDLLSGTIGFYLKHSHPASLLDALANADQLTPALWSTFVTGSSGVDVLCAPEAPHLGPIDSGRLQAVFEYARSNYEWVVVDLPVVFERMSLMSLSNADHAFLVSTPELPSLHLTRKALHLIEQLGFPKDRFRLLLNRFNKRTELGGSEIEKLVNCAVNSKIPNDFLAVNRAITLGEPLDEKCELGKAVETLVSGLSGKTVEPKPKAAAPVARAVLAQVLM